MGGPGLGGHSTTVATYQVKPGSLDRLQELLIRGESRKAYQFASDEKMWAHALLIASGLDKAAWKEVVSEFIQAELGVLAGVDSPINAPSANKRESLRVAYGLIAGDSAAARKCEYLRPMSSIKLHCLYSEAACSSSPARTGPTNEHARTRTTSVTNPRVSSTDQRTY